MVFSSPAAFDILTLAHQNGMDPVNHILQEFHLPSLCRNWCWWHTRRMKLTINRELQSIEHRSKRNRLKQTGR